MFIHAGFKYLRAVQGHDGQGSGDVLRTCIGRRSRASTSKPWRRRRENCNVLTRCSLHISQVNQIVRSQPQGEHPPLYALCRDAVPCASKRWSSAIGKICSTNFRFLSPHFIPSMPLRAFINGTGAIRVVLQERVALPSNAAEC